MPDFHFQFCSIEEVMTFSAWVEDMFDDPEDFERYLASRYPELFEDSSLNVTVVIHAIELIEDADEELTQRLWEEAEFWDMVCKNGLEEYITNDPTIPGSD